MNKLSKLTFIIGLCIWFSSRIFADTLKSYPHYIPAGVSLGMSLAAVKTARPDSILMGNAFEDVQDTDQNFVLVERISANKPLSATYYMFKARILWAVFWVYSGAESEVLKERVRTEMFVGLNKASTDTVKIAINGETPIVPLELWSSANGNPKVYFVLAPHAFQVILFDPTHMSKSDIFPDVDQF